MQEAINRPDIFISYCRKDTVLVSAKLLAPLEAAGLNVIIDYRDFEYGAPSIESMKKAIKESRQIILAITNNWLNSEWCEFENLFAEHLDPTGKFRKIIPVKLDESQPPDLLRTWCDLSNDQFASVNLSKLLSELIINKLEKKQVESASNSNLPFSDPIYNKLRDLLALKSWKEADIETREIICKAVGVSPIFGLRARDFENLSLDVLKVLDLYWSQASRGKFGFAVQYRIFESCKHDWEQFGRHVGWIRNSLWVAYTDIWQHAADNDLREGELPIGGRGGFWAGIGDTSLGNGLFGFVKSQIKLMESGLGDLLHDGGFDRVGKRLIEDITFNNGFSLAWMKPRERLLKRWAAVNAL